MLQEFLGHARRFVDVAAPDAQRSVDDWRVIEHESLFRGRRAVLGLHFHSIFNQVARELDRIGDRGRAADELRFASVKPGDALQPAKHVAKVAAEHAAIGVQLVEHHVTQIFKQASPTGVMRKDAGVQHVRIGKNDMAFFADGLASVAGRIAVIRKHAKAILEALVQVVKFGELILRQGLGGEQVKGAGVSVSKNGVEYREVVAQRLARGGRRDDDDVLPGMDGFCGGRLVRVKLADAFRVVSCAKVRAEPSRKIGPLRFASGVVADGGKDLARMGARSESVEDLGDAREGRGGACEFRRR